MWLLNFFRKRRESREEEILEILRQNGETSGGDLCWMINEGNNIGLFYNDSQRMEKEGKIVSRWGVATEELGWRRPRLYRLPDQLTKEGQK